MWKKINIGMWAGIFVFLVSLIFLFQSFEFDYSASIGPGPGFFPVWLSLILLILSILYIFKSSRNHNDEEESMPKGDALKKIIFTLSTLILFIILLPFLGFILTGSLFLFTLLYREYRWYINVSISLGVSLLLFWIFDSFLHVSLPVNVLGW